MRFWFFWILLIAFFSSASLAADNPFHDKQVSTGPQQWAKFYPYVPEKFDYYFELGSLWEQRSQYWLGAGFGRHLGSCILSASQTCQQYWDLLGGFGGRDGLTTGIALTGLRWQFVDFPSVTSPSLSLLAGMYSVRDDRRRLVEFTYAVGYGLTTTLHKRVDLRIEARVGIGDGIWSQGLFSFHLKLDKWVDYFGAKIKKFGIDSTDAIGSGLESTGSAFESLFNRRKKETSSSNPE
jgi:hypothetical protein